MTKGFTLLEVLLSLALLSGIVLGVASWLSGVHQLARTTESGEWRMAAERVLEGVRIDFRIADFDEEGTPIRSSASGFEVRGRNAAWVPYRLDEDSGVLYRAEDPTPLLGHLRRIGLETDDELRILELELTSVDGDILRRSLSW